MNYQLRMKENTVQRKSFSFAMQLSVRFDVVIPNS